MVGAARGRTPGVILLGASDRPDATGDEVTIRDYEAADEVSWLRCRVQGFLDTSYFDDVWPVRRRADLELVAADGGAVVGLLDVSVPGTDATIGTVTVHPDYRGQGIATALLREAVRRLERCGVRTLDAWTRDDAPALAWFAANAFVESTRYLHIHASVDEVGTVLSARNGLVPAGAFLHAGIERETEMRQRFERVHVCRRFARQI